MRVSEWLNNGDGHCIDASTWNKPFQTPGFVTRALRNTHHEDQWQAVSKAVITVVTHLIKMRHNDSCGARIRLSNVWLHADGSVEIASPRLPDDADWEYRVLADTSDDRGVQYVYSIMLQLLYHLGAHSKKLSSRLRTIMQQALKPYGLSIEGENLKVTSDMYDVPVTEGVTCASAAQALDAPHSACKCGRAGRLACLRREVIPLHLAIQLLNSIEIMHDRRVWTKEMCFAARRLVLERAVEPECAPYMVDLSPSLAFCRQYLSVACHHIGTPPKHDSKSGTPALPP